ncbi:MAG: hypothetical protein KJ548_10080 [Actinobacteria bacterium]|nr:hypothetical protein [Actinomycetota bacterium]MCG2798071.1 hypothetical protein [Cellulomonas sp.]
MNLNLGARAGWALSLVGLAGAGLFASWQSGQLLPAAACDQTSVVWTYDVGQAADGSTQVRGVRFEDVPAACAATPVQVQFRSDGEVVDTQLTTLGEGEVLASVPADAALWVPVG